MRQETRHTLEAYALLFQQGEEEGLAFFYLELHPSLSLYANKYLQNRQVAEEIASNAFVKIWKMHEKLDSYNAIRAYLYKTVYRDAIHALKKEQRRNTVERVFRPQEINNDTPYDHLIRVETCRLVSSALEELSPGNRKVLTMHFLEGKSTTEIATELQLSPNTVRTQKIRGLAALRKLLLPSILIFICLSIKIFLPSL